MNHRNQMATDASATRAPLTPVPASAASVAATFGRGQDMRTVIMQDTLGRAVGRMESARVGCGWMEWRRTLGGALEHGHVRRADRAVAEAARANESATGDRLPAIYT